jgi:hypothetical protein
MLAITIRQVLIFGTRIVRNVLYTPYVISLFLYVFFVLLSISALFLTNDRGLLLIDNLLSLISDFNSHFNFFDSNGSYSRVIDAEEMKGVILSMIVGFAFIYEFVIKAVSFFRNDFNHEVFKRKLFKIVGMFYGITFVTSSIIFTFVLKEYIFTVILLLFLLANICTLFIAYMVTSVFSFIIRIIDAQSKKTIESQL